MSLSPRPSMRTLSRRMRWRMTFLVSALNAPLISFSRPSNLPSSRSLASALMPVELALALLLVGDPQRGGELTLDARW